MADNKYTAPINEIKLGIKAIIADMELADKKIIELANNASKIGASFKTNTPNDLTKLIEQQTNALKLLTEQLSKQANSSEKLNKLTLQEKITRQESLKQLKLQATSNNSLVDSYTRLISQQKIMKVALNDLIATKGKDHEATKRLQSAYDKVAQSTNRANKSFMLFSRGGIQGAIGGIKNLIGAFGVVGGASMFVSMGKEIFNVAKELEKFQFTLKTVTDTSYEFNRVQSFLSDITQKYGVDLLSTTERFTKFFTAAKQSNLALSDTEQIFESVTKASSVLGLKTDELSGVYLALEQMLSKGKVSTEELRRQLGERLPGAFGIMASALNVTTSELDKMLKKGEILSAEALPKFAKELEKAYGIESVTKIDTLVAAQNRLQNTWVELIDVLTNGDTLIKSILSGVLYFAQTTLSVIKEVSESIKEAFTSEATKQATKQMEEFEAVTQRQIESLNSFASIERRRIEALKQIFALQDNISKKIQQDSSFTKDQADETAKSLIRLASVTRDRNTFLKESTKLIERNDLITKGSLATVYSRIKGIDIVMKAIDGQTVAIDGQTVAEEDLNDETTKGMVALKGSISFLEAYIKKLEEKRQKLATTSDEYKNYTKQIENANGELLKLTSTLANPKVEDFSVAFDFQESKDAFDKVYQDREDKAKEINDGIAKYKDKKNKEEADKTRIHFEELDKIVKTTFDTFSEYYDLDLSNFEFLYHKKENTIQDWANAFDDVIDSVLDASLNRYDIELQAAQRNRDLITNNELATEKEKRIANEKFEEDERRIKTKRAKAERNNTLIQIAVDTARGAILAYLSQLIPGDPTSIPRAIGAAAVTTGLGLAQAAIVASQPLPKFAEGTKAPLANDTLAIVGDGGRKEAITENGKLVGVTPDKPTVMRLKKGQEVQKDAKAWIDNAVYRMNMESNGQMLSSVMMDSIIHDEIKKMRADSKRTWEEVKKLANRPVNVNNRVILESKMNEYKQ